MRIETYLNTSKEEVEAKKHNIWIGISLGNKYFTKENIEKYILWSMPRTNEKVLVVIADEIQAINLEVLDNKTPKAAQKKAMYLGDWIHYETQNILSKLAINDKERVELVRWKEVVNTELYKKNLEAIRNYYYQNKEFHDYIIETIKAGRKDRANRISKLSEEELDRLADYILNEIPHFVNGVQGYDELTYTLIPYPGITKLDELFVGLNNKTVFPDLVEQLNVSNKIGILEAYVD